MSTRLIINADDYGRTSENSRGIRHAHLHGMVTSTTCLMNMPTVAQDIRDALNECPTLGMGVQLNLTLGRPLQPVTKFPGLTQPNGSFSDLAMLVSHAQDLDSEIIKNEWRTQVEAFFSAAGQKPTHLDSHEHTSYLTPGMLNSMLELAREFDLPIRLPLAHGYNPYTASLPPELVDAMADVAPKLLEEFQPRSPDAFFASFHDEEATRAEFLRILRLLLPNGCFEIMCHPGYVDETSANESAYAIQRHAELEVLTDAALRKEVERLGIALISFAEI